jgi:hypothetical protein
MSHQTSGSVPFNNPIANCKVEFAFKCPKDWSELVVTDVKTTRFCDVCKNNVYFVSTIEEVHERASRGECIAVFDASAALRAAEISKSDERIKRISMTKKSSILGYPKRIK